MNLTEVIAFLTKNPDTTLPYLVKQKGKYLLTKRFYQDVDGQDIGITTVVASIVEAKPAKKEKLITGRGDVIVAADAVDWVKLYQDFIIEAGVPQFGVMSNGNRYDMRRATKPGREAFKKALIEGASYDKLLKATKLYYSTRGVMYKKIENYFLDELWRSDYGVQNTTQDDTETRQLGF